MKRLYLYSICALITLLQTITSCNSGDNDDEASKASTDSIYFAVTDSGSTNSYALISSGVARYFDGNYMSRSTLDRQTKMSGRVYLSPSDEKSKSVKGIILVNHYTIAAESECPTENDNAYESAFVALGYAVIVPDYFGFGLTRQYPQTYLHAETTAYQSLDMLTAAKKWLQQRGFSIGDNVFNIGYSQGGAVAMAVQRYSEENNIDITMTFAGAGPYDIDSTYKYQVRNDFTSYPVEIPLLVTGMNYAYNLKLDFTKIFKQPLLSNYEEWIYTKNYTASKINSLIGTNTISEILQPAFLDTTNTDNIKFRQAMKDNSLVSGWVSKVRNPIYLFHSKTDDIVPTFNSEELYNKLKSDGYTDKNLTLYEPTSGSHGNSGISFYLICYLNIAQR